MKWILTEKNVLINVDNIGTIHVACFTRVAPVKPSVAEDIGRNYIETKKYAVVADLNYFDSERDYIYLTHDINSKDIADDVFQKVVKWISSNKNGVAKIKGKD